MNGKQLVAELRRLHGQSKDTTNSLARLLAEAEGVPDGGQSEDRGDSSQPPAAGPAPQKTDLASAAQLGYLRRLAADLRLDLETECQKFYDKGSHELSKRDASALIDRYNALKRQEEAA
ncbi:MAG TPA: hypothetical protein VK421_06195 [Pyrinomonadaceae bacterium]|nr:hypothetical protein [Pyrinomonadaceae bacterium]